MASVPATQGATEEPGVIRVTPMPPSSGNSNAEVRQGSRNSLENLLPEGSVPMPSSKSTDECGHQGKLTAAAVGRTVAKLKKQIQLEHNAYVQGEFEKNRKFLNDAMKNMTDAITYEISSDVAFTGPPISTRPQMAADGGKEKNRILVKMPATPLVPRYVTWIHINRNQRMTEDQSYEGRRRLYYDAEKDETTVCSESDEDLEAEEYKHDFKPGDDTIILGAIEEHGLCQLVVNELSSSLKVKPADIQERFLELQEKKKTMGNSIEGSKDIQSKLELVTEPNLAGMPSSSQGAPATEVNFKVKSNSAKCESETIRKDDAPIPREDSVIRSNEAKGKKEAKVKSKSGTSAEEKAENELPLQSVEAGVRPKVKVTQEATGREAEKLPEDLKDLMDTCDHLFCRRCLVFDCRLHGNEIIPEPHEKQPPATLPQTGQPCGRNCHRQPSHANLLEQLRQSLQNWAGGGQRESSTGAPVGRTSSSAQEVPGTLESLQDGNGKVEEDGEQVGEKTRTVFGRPRIIPSVSPESEEKGKAEGTTFEKTCVTTVEAGSVCAEARKVDGDEEQSSPPGGRKRVVKRSRDGKRFGRWGDHNGGRSGRGRGGRIGAVGRGDDVNFEEHDRDDEVENDRKKSRVENSRKGEEKEQAVLLKEREVEGQEGEGKGSEERLQEGHGDSRVEQVEGGDGKLGEGSQDETFPEDENWSKLERQLYDKGVQMYGYDSCRIARSLNGLKSCAETAERMIKEMARRQSSDPKISTAGEGDDESAGVTLQRRPTRRRGKLALSRSGRSRSRTLQPGALHGLRKDKHGRELRSHYNPCACKGQCNRSTCTCFVNGNVCEKYCACSKQCKQRFPGCQCGKSQCASRQCPCFAADRECDPDVCKNCWLGCGDGTLEGPQPRSESFQCKNMKVLLRQHQRILLGESDIQGWGAFVKSSVAKNEYIGEYTGELISHQEADRRGKIYDRVNSSFLFDLDDQYVLDACRRGNKLKFANHSPTPNCYAKVTKVAGDHRVGIFSKEKIAAGDELFYDYGYTLDQAPPWWETAAEGNPGNNLRRNTKAV